jgi:DNA polymerase-1
MTKDANEHPPKAKGEGLAKSKSEQLDTPVNIASPTQLAILLYDVLGTKVVDKKSPRGTGEDILKKIDLPICSLILEHRGLMKLLNTYIDSIPTLVTPKTGRVHTHFNQYGAATGRFSSSDPLNLQNIPSHNKEIRLMFKAKDGYTFVGSDYSL